MSNKNSEIAVLGAGCFWCVEAIFQDLRGVKLVIPGYSGGHVANPNYDLVCSGTSGHAEVAKIEFDPEIISFAEILDVFWLTHDPTSLNRQGADVGTQYRSVIFFADSNQEKAAIDSKKDIEEKGIFDKEIVTEISPLKEFYPAEDYHNDYFRLNPEQAYCQAVINPKVQKFRKIFSDKLKN